jgi:hypothetical protein
MEDYPLKNKLFLIMAFALLAIGLTQIQTAQADGPDGLVVVDQVWHDANMNGIQDEPDIGVIGSLYNVIGMTVKIYTCDTSVPLASKVTNIRGVTSFSGLAAGDYYVKFFLDPGFTGHVFSPRHQGGNPEKDSDAKEDGTTDCFYVPSHPGGTKFVDAGIYTPPLQALTTEKDAVGSYDRTVTWTLEKSVTPGSHSGNAGEAAGASTWTVVATKSETLSSYEVTGSIKINNPNNIPVEFSVTDTLNDGTAGVVTCPSTTVTANDSVTCTYTASPADGVANLNTAVVTALTDGVGGATATFPVSFSENLSGYDSGTLSDPRFGYSEVISATTTNTFPETFTCPTDASLYTNGVYKFTETNTAALNGNPSLEASASVTVTCSLPQNRGVLLIIDEDSLDNGIHFNASGGLISPSGPNFFSVQDVNDDIASIGQRSVLRYFSNNIGRTITVRTGQTGDEGWFAPTCIPSKWNSGSSNACIEPGSANFTATIDKFWAGIIAQSRLDKTPHVMPLRALGLNALVGKDVCAVVYDSDISINYDHGTASLGVNGNLQGATLGVVAFRVDATNTLNGFSSSTLPQVTLTINDPSACGNWQLFNAPVPASSSTPNDRVSPGSSSGYLRIKQWSTLPLFFPE